MVKIPRLNFYRKGVTFEYCVRDFFRKKGYYCSRSPASKFPDLIIISPEGQACFIECKNQKIVPKDLTRLLSGEEYEQALKLINDYKIPFFLFYKENHKMKAVAIGGKGVVLLEELGF